MDCFGFVIVKTKEGKYKNTDAVFMKVQINNVVVAAFLNPILLVYEKDTKSFYNMTAFPILTMKMAKAM